MPPATSRELKFRNYRIKKVAEYLRRAQNPIIAVGDFNLTPFSPVYEEFLTENPTLQDGRRLLGFEPSWPAFIPPLWTPIDHIFASRRIEFKNLYRWPIFLVRPLSDCG